MLLPDDDRIFETCRSILNNFICFNVLKLCTSGNNKNKFLGEHSVENTQFEVIFIEVRTHLEGS